MTRFWKRAVKALVLASALSHVACGSGGTGGEQEGLGTARAALWVDLASQVGSPVATGNTLGGADEYQPPSSCSDSPGGPDVSFKWTAPQTGSYTFTTAGSTLDTVLHIYRFSNTALLGCNDDVVVGSNFTSSVALSLVAGDTLRIVIDSYEPPNSKNGGFKLNITSNIPPACNTPPSACHNAPGTWNGTACVYTPKSQGSACDDGNACTTGDVCNGSGACGGTPLVCTSPPGQCHQSTGTCSNGTCNYAPKSQGTACNDGNACTTSDVCNGAGACGGNPMQCNSPPGQCYESPGTCVNGTCEYSFSPPGTSCDDNEACTISTECTAYGQCVPTSFCTCPEGTGCFGGACYGDLPGVPVQDCTPP